MAIDQRDVSSTLRFMDDRALQQYAAMHKNDPYIFPLAFQESQNRQRLRQQAQMQMAGQPQPKVVDQALAGISTLPADNMKFAAEGGIVGYEGYDESGVPDTFGQGPVVMMAEGGVARYQFGGSTMGGFTPDFAQADLASQAADLAAIDRRNAPTVAKIAELRQRAEALQSVAPELIPAINEQIAALTASISPAAAPTAPKGTMPEPGYTRKGFEGDPRLNTPPTQPVGAAPRADTGRKDTGRTAAAAAAAAAPSTTEPSAKTDTGGLDTLMAEFKRNQELAIGAAKNADVQYASSLRNEGAKLVADEEKRIKDQIDPYKDREVRLLKQEKDLEKMPDKYLGIALLKAGADMMRTPGKFNLGKVLGAGIQVGSESYVQGMEKINAAKDKFALAKEKLEDLRINRADMNDRELKDARKEARLLERQAEGLFYTGAREDLKMTNQGITALFAAAAENLKTDKTITASAEETNKRIKSNEKIAAIGESGANARANAPSASMREAMLLGTGTTDKEKYESGLKRVQELTADKTGMAAFKILGEINAKNANDPNFKPLTLADLTAFQRDYQKAMRAGPANVSNKPTGKAFD